MFTGILQVILLKGNWEKGVEHDNFKDFSSITKGYNGPKLQEFHQHNVKLPNCLFLIFRHVLLFTGACNVLPMI